MLDASILASLRCFDVAARLLSFTAAAQQLHLTQSAVSQQMRQLEQRLGYPLFVRQHRRLQLTAQGQALYRSVSTALQDIDSTLQQLARQDSVLHISCAPSFALDWLMPRLSAFQQQYPAIPVRLRAEFQRMNRQDMLAAGVDVSIRYDPDEMADLPGIPLLDEVLLPVASPALLAAQPALATANSLTRLHDSAAWDGAPPFAEWDCWQQGAAAEFRFAPGAWQEREYNLASLSLAAACQGQGVAMARAAQVLELLQQGRLQQVYPATVAAPARYVLRSLRPEDRRVQLFCQWLQQQCQQFVRQRQQLLGV
ncbi:LysR family transcriptional regulator [Aquitalea sp. ASV15]|uniref:LysR family transcriptional regulator n=1 Tax=Aquitalea sp. ASV15 TaxID=2795104 RepID=UPI0018EA7078|nr:LysR family transcriptional regulator [Aquitalea sp. ASV15]